MNSQNTIHKVADADCEDLALSLHYSRVRILEASPTSILPVPGVLRLITKPYRYGQHQ